MTTLTEGKHAGGFLVWEAFRDCTRDVITLAAGDLFPGTALGRITATANYAAHNSAAVDGTETAVAVLWGRADATGGEAPGVALLRGRAIVNRHDLVFASTPGEAAIAAAHSALLAAGILVR
jgi:hypothetical protein